MTHDFHNFRNHQTVNHTMKPPDRKKMYKVLTEIYEIVDFPWQSRWPIKVSPKLRSHKMPSNEILKQKITEQKTIFA